MSLTEKYKWCERQLTEKCREVNFLKAQLDQCRSEHQSVVESFDSHIAELNKALVLKNNQISILETENVHNASLERSPEIQNQYQCVICTSNLSSTDAICATRCGHVYHSNCITTWIKTSQTCPQCRKPISAQHLIKLFFDIGESERSDEPDAVVLQSMITEKKRQDNVNKAQEQQICNQKNKISDLLSENVREKAKFMKALTVLENFYNRSLNTFKNNGFNVSNLEKCTASNSTENNFQKLLNNSKKLMAELQQIVEDNNKKIRIRTEQSIKLKLDRDSNTVSTLLLERERQSELVRTQADKIKQKQDMLDNLSKLMQKMEAERSNFYRSIEIIKLCLHSTAQIFQLNGCTHNFASLNSKTISSILPTDTKHFELLMKEIPRIFRVLNDRIIESNRKINDRSIKFEKMEKEHQSAQRLISTFNAFFERHTTFCREHIFPFLSDIQVDISKLTDFNSTNLTETKIAKLSKLNGELLVCFLNIMIGLMKRNSMFENLHGWTPMQPTDASVPPVNAHAPPAGAIKMEIRMSQSRQTEGQTIFEPYWCSRFLTNSKETSFQLITFRAIARKIRFACQFFEYKTLIYGQFGIMRS